MNAPFDPPLLAAGKFAVGQPVSRKEDPVLLRGEGRYTDDLNRPDQLYAVMVRSRVAHGIISSVDVEAAREMPGVRAVILAADLDAAWHTQYDGGGRQEPGWYGDAPAAAAPVGDRPCALCG
jgi:carbon-monoxide dehydrogenase large subunit